MITPASVMHRLLDLPGAFKRWLKDLPTTALIIVAGCALSVATAAFYFGAELTDHELQPELWYAWLAFLAAMLGISYRWFKAKRETWQPEGAATATPPIHDPGA